MPSTEMVTYTTKHRERTRYILTPKAALSASYALTSQISPRYSGNQCICILVGRRPDWFWELASWAVEPLIWCRCISAGIVVLPLDLLCYSAKCSPPVVTHSEVPLPPVYSGYPEYQPICCSKSKWLIVPVWLIKIHQNSTELHRTNMVHASLATVNA